MKVGRWDDGSPMVASVMLCYILRHIAIYMVVLSELWASIIIMTMARTIAIGQNVARMLYLNR